jgi:hypothetical protein
LRQAVGHLGPFAKSEEIFLSHNSWSSRGTLGLLIPAILAAIAPASRAQNLAPTTNSERSSSLLAQSSANPFLAHLDNIDYRGWHAIRLSNGLISLIIVPQIGGRAIQLKLGDQELFFVNPALAGKVLTEAEENPSTGQWNYGGDKVWPAPEGWLSDDQWSSIPDYPLDGKPATAIAITNNSREVALRVTGPAVPRTGVQFERTYHVFAGSTRIQIEQIMRNISRRQIRWGIWHLVQHDAADSNDPTRPNPDLNLYVPLNPHSHFPSGYQQMYGEPNHPSYSVVHNGKILRAHYLYQVGKIAVDSDTGWYAVVNSQKKTCFVENFKFFPGEEYPDGASVESWNDGPGKVHRDPFDQILKNDARETPYFFESEVLSPLITLNPGEEHSFPIEWAVTGSNGPVVESRWIGVVNEPLSATAAGNTVELRAVLGVFAPGSLYASFYDQHGVILAHKKLLDVDPRTAIQLSQHVDRPAGTFRVSVSLQDADGENLGFLGNAIFH